MDTTEAIAMNLRQQLEALLSEGVSDAQIREHNAFALARGKKSGIVIVGAGRLGRNVLQGLRRTGMEPAALTDNNEKLWGQTIEGLPVLPPGRAAELYSGNAAFVVSVWNPQRMPLMSRLLSQLDGLACCGVPFPILFWQMPDEFLPYYLWELPSKLLLRRLDILEAFDMLGDDISRSVFVSQVGLRLRADFQALPEISREDQYFPGLFRLTRDETFVDCGAYDGDTIRSVVQKSGGRFKKVIAFEIDPAVTSRLKSCIAEIGSRAVIHSAAVSRNSGKLPFIGDGLGGGRISDEAGTSVPCVRLDEVLADEQPSFIKMDIEGSELDALHGAQATIRKHRPVLAICAYHRQDHLWTIPQILHTLLPDAILFMRAHRSDGFDVVCYAVPRERMVRGNQPAAQDCPSLSRSV